VITSAYKLVVLALLSGLCTTSAIGYPLQPDTDLLEGLGSIPQSVSDLFSSRAFFDYPIVCTGRLTTESGQPLSTSDRAAQGTLYFTPYRGQSIALWSPSRWKLYRLTERSLSLSVTANKNYDVFVYNNSGTLTMELSSAWTDDYNRADALMHLDGVLVKASDNTRRYVGSVRASGTNTTEDSETKRFVWNYYNRVSRTLRASSTTSHTYSSTTLRYFNNSSANQVEFLIGESQGYRISLEMSSSANGKLALGVNSIVSPLVTVEQTGADNSTENMAAWDAIPFGYWYVAPLEAAVTGTVTFSSYSLRGNLRN
jgi:hypothetical protein